MARVVATVRPLAGAFDRSQLKVVGWTLHAPSHSGRPDLQVVIDGAVPFAPTLVIRRCQFCIRAKFVDVYAVNPDRCRASCEDALAERGVEAGKVDLVTYLDEPRHGCEPVNPPPRGGAQHAGDPARHGLVRTRGRLRSTAPAEAASGWSCTCRRRWAFERDDQVNLDAVTAPFQAAFGGDEPSNPDSWGSAAAAR